MAVICPSVLATEPQTFQSQMESLQPFAERVQIDLTDGVFAKNRTIDIDEVWWPFSMQADLHLMYRQPLEYVSTILRLKPQLVIVHAEAKGSYKEFSSLLHEHDIRVGVALLKQTPVDIIRSEINQIDHVLIFSGELGHFGGRADLELLKKVEQVRQLGSQVEIGWDGGVNASNAASLFGSGVEVLNVGGFIQNADDPAAAYATLKAVAEKSKWPKN